MVWVLKNVKTNLLLKRQSTEISYDRCFINLNKMLTFLTTIMVVHYGLFDEKWIELDDNDSDANTIEYH